MFGLATGPGGAMVNESLRGHMPAITVALGISQLALGLWMAISPESFFRIIGGLGGRNPHYVRDVSTIYFALGLALLVASRRPAWRPPVFLVAALQYGIHALNHLLDVGRADPSWIGPFDLVTIAVATVLFGYL